MRTINLNPVGKQERKPIMPEAVIRWTHGLDAAPEIFPLAETLEEACEVEKLLEWKLLLDR